MFPRSGLYRSHFSFNTLGESRSAYFPYTERHLQALWFDDSFRPDVLHTRSGEPVEIENPGRWNLEAGPDFKGAVFRVGKERRRLAGDAEVHISPEDWHGHHTDSRYGDVRLHVTWFHGTLDEALHAPGTIHIVLSDKVPLDDLDRIDVGAYPYAAPSARTSFPLANRSEEEIVALLESAGEERLRRKALRMETLIRQRGAAQALYEETAAALGYKNNKVPFRLLARRVPLESLKKYGSDWKTVYSVLLGLAGLLPKQAGSAWPDESKEELRSLWDRWWREEHRWEDVEPLQRSEWNLSGMRPLNHPVRRLCALAQWVAGGFFQKESVSSGLAEEILQDCFWSRSAGWKSAVKQAALVGSGRMSALDLNVFIPFRLTQAQCGVLKHIPAEPLNSVHRETAFTLFGPDHSPRLYRSAMARQGLVQMFHDLPLLIRQVC
jgi:hypothetical protein